MFLIFGEEVETGKIEDYRVTIVCNINTTLSRITIERLIKIPYKIDWCTLLYTLYVCTVTFGENSGQILQGITDNICVFPSVPVTIIYKDTFLKSTPRQSCTVYINN